MREAAVVVPGRAGVDLIDWEAAFQALLALFAHTWAARRRLSQTSCLKLHLPTANIHTS